jgi:ubiquinone/menaquinone biosynthesis C-methylase UbiE
MAAPDGRVDCCKNARMLQVVVQWWPGNPTAISHRADEYELRRCRKARFRRLGRDRYGVRTSFTTETISNWTDNRGDMAPILAHGRRYHESDAVLTPDDDDERDRLNGQHELFKACRGGELTATKINGDGPLKVLDVGTGSAIWAMEMGERHRQAQIVGVDISRAKFPETTPANVRLLACNVNEEWDWCRGDGFDLIHIRNLFGGVTDWKALLGRALHHLEAGGRIEVSDCRVSWQENYCGPAINMAERFKAGQEFEKALSSAMAQLGFELEPIASMMTWLVEAGFEDVRQVVEYAPHRPWAPGAEMKHRGRLVEQLTRGGLESVSMRALGKCGWADEDTRTLIDRVLEELQDPTLAGYGAL